MDEGKKWDMKIISLTKEMTNGREWFT